MTTLKTITLRVRQEFEIPAVFRDGTMDEIEEALMIGAIIQQSVHTRRAQDGIQKMMEEKDQEIQRIQRGYHERISLLEREIQSAREEITERVRTAQKVERDSCSKEAEESARIAKKEHELLVARYDALMAHKRVVEESRAKDIQDAVVRTEAMMQKVVESKESQLVKMESAFGKLQDTIAKQSEEVSKLSSTLGKRAANVKTKGNDYEEQFGDRLRRYYGLMQGFGLRSTGLGAGHEMDFAMDVEGHVVMWELKSYGSLVPKAEVDKFLRDLKENPQAKVGVMISRTTDIHGKQNGGSPMVTEFDGDKMMIYINRFEDFCGEDEQRVFSMFLSLFRIWWQYHHEENNGFDRVEIIREVEKAVEELAKRRVEWKRHRAHLEEIGRWTTDLIEECEDRLDRVLKRARNASDVVINGTPVEIPDGIFRETGEEKERTWVNSIMKVCVGGGEIEVRALVDALRAHHKLSADTIRGNVMAVLRDSAVVKKGIVKYVRGISIYVPPCEIKMK
jgi:hypothetical protein